MWQHNSLHHHAMECFGNIFAILSEDGGLVVNTLEYSSNSGTVGCKLPRIKVFTKRKWKLSHVAMNSGSFMLLKSIVLLTGHIPLELKYNNGEAIKMVSGFLLREMVRAHRRGPLEIFTPLKAKFIYTHVWWWNPSPPPHPHALPQQQLTFLISRVNYHLFISVNINQMNMC